MRVKTPWEVQVARTTHIQGFHRDLEVHSRDEMAMGQANKVGTAAAAHKCSTSRRSDPLEESQYSHISIKSRALEGSILQHLLAWVVSLGILWVLL